MSPSLFDLPRMPMDWPKQKRETRLVTPPTTEFDMCRWQVQLVGEEQGIEDLEEFLPADGWQIRREDDSAHLVNPSLDSEEDPNAVWRTARFFLRSFTAALRVLLPVYPR